MKKPHIGFVIGNLDNHGGTERVSTMLANEFCKHGYDVTFISPRSEGKIFFPLDSRIKTYCLSSQYSFFSKLRIWKRFYLLILLIIWRRRIDIIIDVDLGTAHFTAPIIRFTRCEEITWDHFNYKQNEKVSYRQSALELVKKYASKLVVLTKADAQMYLSNTDLSTDFIEQIYNPLTFNIGAPIPHASKRVVAVGRMTEQKGFDILLDIWHRIEALHPSWTLEIIGNGEDEVSLKEQSKKLGLTRVVFSEPTNDIQSKLQEASIYVLSSRYEGFPMVLLEATAMSLPIVAFDCLTGPSEIVKDGCNGYLIPTFDEEKFAQRLSSLIENEGDRTLFGKKSFEISQQYKMSNIFKKWEKLINEVLK